MARRPSGLLVAIFIPCFTLPADAGQTLRVGPGHRLTMPSEAAELAKDGAVVEIEAGLYRNDVAVWTQNNLTLRGVGGRAHLKAEGRSAEDKAIWVIKGDKVHVEHIEFSGAKVADENGAGIRAEGRRLSVSDCYFHDNENGVLSANDPHAEILIERSEFARNGFGDGYSHNIYVGTIARFTLQFSYSHHAHIGHQVKSRARENHILFNRIMDEEEGDASYQIDLPNPGEALIMGNLLQQGRHADNWTLVRVVQNAVIVNNTLVNDFGDGIFVEAAEGGRARLVNNVFVGKGRVLVGSGALDANVTQEDAGLVDRRRFDYRLRAGSPAIDVGLDAVKWAGVAFPPAFEYRHPLSGVPRKVQGKVDAGAFEFNATD